MSFPDQMKPHWDFGAATVHLVKDDETGLFVAEGRGSEGTWYAAGRSSSDVSSSVYAAAALGGGGILTVWPDPHDAISDRRRREVGLDKQQGEG
jgi:hypothetical protein